MTDSRPMPLKPVHVPEVEGVKVRRHVLDHEASRVAGIAQRLGKRLNYRMRLQGAHELPDQEWRETYELYAKIVLGLLREQRERAKLSPATGAPALSDEEFSRELAEFRRETVHSLSDEEIRAEVARRAERSLGSK